MYYMTTGKLDTVNCSMCLDANRSWETVWAKSGLENSWKKHFLGYIFKKRKDLKSQISGVLFFYLSHLFHILILFFPFNITSSSLQKLRDRLISIGHCFWVLILCPAFSPYAKTLELNNPKSIFQKNHGFSSPEPGALLAVQQTLWHAHSSEWDHLVKSLGWKMAAYHITC